MNNLKTIIALCLLLSIFSSAAAAQSGGTFTIRKSVIAGGGEKSAGGGITVQGTIGQPLAGMESAGGNIRLRSGFWGGGSLAVSAPQKSLFDFDGDGRSDISVFRPNGGFWYLNQSKDGITGVQFGASSDQITPADYDGDGKTDIAVYRAGTWYLLQSTDGFTGFAFGEATDIPVPADYTGDGKADLAVWRPSNGTWYIYNLMNNQFTAAQFGASTDKPVVGDFNGDGKSDYAVFRPSNGFWYITKPTGIPSQNFDSIQFGRINRQTRCGGLRWRRKNGCRCLSSVKRNVVFAKKSGRIYSKTIRHFDGFTGTGGL